MACDCLVEQAVKLVANCYIRLLCFNLLYYQNQCWMWPIPTHVLMYHGLTSDCVGHSGELDENGQLTKILFGGRLVSAQGTTY